VALTETGRQIWFVTADMISVIFWAKNSPKSFSKTKIKVYITHTIDATGQEKVKPKEIEVKLI